MLNHRRGSEEYRELETERADIESQTARLDKRIAMENGRLNQLRQQSRQLHTAMGVHGTPTSLMTEGRRFTEKGDHLQF